MLTTLLRTGLTYLAFFAAVIFEPAAFVETVSAQPFDGGNLAAGLLFTAAEGNPAPPLGQVYMQRFDTDGNAVGYLFLVSPGQVKAVAPGANTAVLEMFVIGTDDQVYFLKLSSTGVATTPYTPIPNPVKAISVGIQELFVIGTDDQVYFHKLDSAGNPVGNYVPLPGPVKMKAISAGRGYPWLFAIGVDNQAYMQRFNANGDPVGGYVLIPNPVKAIAAGFYANPGLFVIGTDDQVYVHQFDYNGNPVGSYVRIPNPVKAISTTTAFAAGSSDFGTALLAVIGTDNQVYLHLFDVNGNATGNYIAIATPPMSPCPPAIMSGVQSLHVARVYNHPELFVIGNDNTMAGHRLDAYGNPVGSYFGLPHIGGVLPDFCNIGSIGGIITFPTPQ